MACNVKRIRKTILQIFDEASMVSINSRIGLIKFRSHLDNSITQTLAFTANRTLLKDALLNHEPDGSCPDGQLALGMLIVFY